MYGYGNRFDLSHLVHAKYRKVKAPFSWYTVLCTWFYIGKFPIMPGTLGAIAAYPLYYLVIKNSSSLPSAQNNLYIAIGFLTIIGYLAIDKFHSVTKAFDHSMIVLDEVIGQLLTCAVTLPWLFQLSKSMYFLHSFTHYNFAFIVAFIFFRFYDIYKPFFLKTIDRKIKTAFGVIIDDIFAALFAIGSIYIIYQINKYIR